MKRLLQTSLLGISINQSKGVGLANIDKWRENLLWWDVLDMGIEVTLGSHVR